jgi:hypothetical protein
MKMPTIVPARRVTARVVRLLRADAAKRDDPQGFVSAPVDALDVTFEGIPGERHHGVTRPADARVPWYRRGTPLRNVRQVTLVSVEELAEIAALMGFPELRPEWLGANIVLDGLPRLSFLPNGSRLYFKSGATLIAEGYNAPCAITGQAVANGSGRGDRQAFVKPATRRRGILATVERPGRIAAGAVVDIAVPDQWTYG